jgi:hypothetical protein
MELGRSRQGTELGWSRQGTELGRIVSGHRRLGSAVSGHRRLGSAVSGHRRLGRVVGHSYWETCQQLHELPKSQVVQPLHPPLVEWLLKGQVEEVFESRIVVAQTLCCNTEPEGKSPHVSALLTDGAQRPDLEDT